MEKYRYSDAEREFMENSTVPFGIYQFINKRVTTILLSKGFLNLFGHTDMSKKEIYALMDTNMYRYAHPDDVASLGDAAYRFATEDVPYDVIYRIDRDGEYRIIHSYGRHIYKENGVRLAFIWYTDQGVYVEDGKNEKDGVLNALKKQLAERSYNIRVEHDYLTGLPSMTYFFDLAEAGCKEIRSKGKMPAIMFMDFNGMKVFNQKYGLQEGDRLLKTFSEEIIDLFSHESCSRFSADHFCVYTDEANARNGALHLMEVNNRLEADKRMPLRIGIYLYDDENISVSGACDRAKIACDSGRNSYSATTNYFDQKMMTALEDRRYVTDNIDKAIKEEWIKTYYQPIVRTANGKVCHEEALSRWIDPVKGFFSPATFIPALEETNTIYKLDLYVVDSVLKKMKEQAESGLYVVPVSVNLSRSDFYTCDIVEEIRKRVDDAGIPRERLVIEITESIVANDVDYMIKEIKRFKELGFPVWMDDYGSGYSSPMILQNIPFDLIKIDMLFVRQLGESEKAGIILTELVRMAMSLGMDTVAEGVETKEQADFLNDIGCTMLQGFYFCKPLSLAEIIERYKQGIQIGFENPEESEYYALLGKVNLYNLSISSTDDNQCTDYFDTWPMVMVECANEKLSVVRANMTFKKYIKDYFPNVFGKTEFDASKLIDKPGAYSLSAVLQCAKDGKRVIIDDRTSDGKIIQILVWRVAVNPITDVVAVMIAILSSAEKKIEYTEEEYYKALHKISNDFSKLQKENERLKEEADANRKIAELKKSVSALLTNMPAMTFSKDVVTRKYLACNQAFADYAHKETPEGVVGLTDFEIFDPATAYHFIEDDKKALAMDRPYIFYEDVPDAEGNPRQFQTTKLKFTDDTGRECLLGLCQDVTDAMRIKREYVQKLARVQTMAEIDALTGIKNKNAYQEREELMNRRIRENRQPEFAIVVLDVNDLKKINDTLGHKAGDKCICEACEIICDTFKRSPVFRIGGDEFVVISQDEDYEHSEELVDIIARHNEDAICNGGIVIACGMAKFGDEENVAAVFTNADKIMYENKKYLKERREKS
ncbi:EAL domain-containing protein [Butyrivibrio sp. YAB3001]|uniref:EAL domain-containing protein n=1 Tax=Butyrivibrio sp. YAB3001 TaxID=1520812 RepID=UPI0008F63216|nr:EAL domain-containing protein [Butyrivibrio sp. YAB3001]SFD05353.1 diguanylate cyclase (GGDEF) domain-containing protein [Butyrivibrio sp. YAB3001]